MAAKDLHQLQGKGIFISGAWVYALMRLTTPTLFAN
jgi:hypothetical protein